MKSGSPILLVPPAGSDQALKDDLHCCTAYVSGLCEGMCGFLFIIKPAHRLWHPASASQDMAESPLEAESFSLDGVHLKSTPYFPVLHRHYSRVLNGKKAWTAQRWGVSEAILKVQQHFHIHSWPPTAVLFLEVTGFPLHFLCTASSKVFSMQHVLLSVLHTAQEKRNLFVAWWISSRSRSTEMSCNGQQRLAMSACEHNSKQQETPCISRDSKITLLPPPAMSEMPFPTFWRVPNFFSPNLENKPLSEGLYIPHYVP